MKKIKLLIIILSLILFLLCCYLGIKKYREYLKIKNAKVNIILVDDLTIGFYEEAKVSDFIQEINGNIIDDYDIDTTIVSKQKIEYEYINEENIRLKQSFIIEVVDKTPPLIWLNSTYSIAVGSSDNLLENILCADNLDSNPNCYIEGEYDLNTIGKYPVFFKAVDIAGNESVKEFTINVYEPKKTSSSSIKTSYKQYADIVKEYKTDNTKIGIDISEWQDYPDFAKLKEAGVEFVIIRVGGTKGREGDYFVDKSFEYNLENAKKYNIPIGLYFFSYATSIEKAKENANWVLKQINGEKIDLPISFDWENWNNFNKYHISFYELTKMANTFIDTVEKAGYQGMNYGSKTYLENMWLPSDNITWLAHYTSKTNYEGKYKFWQICDNALVDGIDGPVDVNIMFEE